MSRFHSDRGATLIEYSLLIALIALACLLAVHTFGDATAGQLSRSASTITDAG